LVRYLLNLFSNKVISLITNTAIRDSIIRRMLGTVIANSVDSHKSSLAKTAAAEPILIESAERSNEFGASLSIRVINLVAGTLRAGSVDKIISKFANAGLLFI